MDRTRRLLLRQAAVLAGAGLMPAWGARALANPKLGAYPFTLGVASGDPAPDGMVLWTKLAPRPLEPTGGMPPEPVQVRWEVAGDEGFKTIAASGQSTARPEAGHAVHVEPAGLKPDRPYWYRFHAAGETSPVGRARTLPAAGADVRRLRYTFSACQHYETGNYAAYRQMVADDPDLIFFLGDYIYERGGRPNLVRRHPDGEAQDLASYRLRYATYRLDPLLQAAHAAAPWMTIWDDHEVRNNYDGDHADGADPATFLARRTAAYQAYYEHMPLRRRSAPVGPHMQLYRTLDYGRLAQFQFVDARQYRDASSCGVQIPNARVPDSAALHDPCRSLLGQVQEKWLYGALSASKAKWNVLAQQFIMAEFGGNDPKTGAWGYATDGWDGYPAARERLLTHWRDAKVSNPVAIGGDIHSFVASDLKLSKDGPVIAPAFVGGAIASSSGPYEDLRKLADLNPQIRFVDNRQNGYALVEVTPAETRLRYRAVAKVADVNSQVADLTSFVVEAGQPKFQQA